MTSGQNFGWWCADARSRRQTGWLKRFDPMFWTVDFPRPMMAAVNRTGPHALRVDAVFYRHDDLAGLIWWSEDRFDHPMLGYETGRDYRGVKLRFHWRSAGIRGLDAVDGPTLTIEGRDAAGQTRSWYVRLWNYAKGTPTDASIDLDFGSLNGGFLLPGEADPVWAGDIDRLFISLVPPGFDRSPRPLDTPQEAWVELSDMACTGSGSTLRLGDLAAAPHGLGVASGYDDSYHLTPERLVRNALRLGYRGVINHYVGMSHYFRLTSEGDGFKVTSDGGVLNTACAAWHHGLARAAAAVGMGVIVSLSYELFDAHCPEGWKQRDASGAPARTGWEPPSTLLSPANAAAMAYLREAACAFMAIVTAEGQAPRFQIGEPWWWINPGGRICLYDDAARGVFGASAPLIHDVRGAQDATARALLDRAGRLLASSTAALFSAVRARFPGTERLMLIYLPTLLDETMPEVRRANLPGDWASPAFDVLQIEDYEWVTSGRLSASEGGAQLVTSQLGYPVEHQHYLSGFILRPEERAGWAAIVDAASVALGRGVPSVFLWALPQVMRDGLMVFRSGDSTMQAFDDVSFPFAIGMHASVSPMFSTAVVTSASGHEQRNADWASARLQYDAGLGLRSERDVAALIGFFRARRGAAKGFRFRDPLDFSSRGMTDPPTPLDQIQGKGDGDASVFPLVKSYGEGPEREVRRITRPVATSVVVAVAGRVAVNGWSLGEGGEIRFTAPPAAGATVTAGFLFDVPVRFAEDRLDVALPKFLAGEAINVPLIEVREGE